MSERAPQLPQPADQERPNLELIQGGLSESAEQQPAPSELSGVIAEASGRAPVSATTGTRKRRGASRAEGAPADDIEIKRLDRSNDANHKYDEIADLVNIDVKGRGHISGSHKAEGSDARARNGQFLSDREMAIIASHQAQIREGMEVRNAEGGDEPEATPPAGTNNPGNPNGPGGAGTGEGGNGGDGPEGPDDPNHAPQLERFADGDNDFDTLRKNIMHEFPIEMAEELGKALNDYTKLETELGSSTIRGGNVKMSTRYATNQYGEVLRHLDGSPVEEQRTVRATPENVERARLRYEELRHQAKAWEREQMERFGLSGRDQATISRLQDLTEGRMVALGCRFDAESMNDKHLERFKEKEDQSAAYRARTYFLNKWSKWGGGKHRMVGKVKKGLLMGAIGLPVGAAAGAVGVFLAGPVLGAALAGGAAHGIARGLMRGKIDKSANAKTTAYARYDSRYHRQVDRINAAYEPDADGNFDLPESVTDSYGEQTTSDVTRNRKRAIGSVVIGAAGGALGLVGGHYIGDWIQGLGDTSSGSNAAPKGPAMGGTHPEVHNGGGAGTSAPLHGGTGEGFNVEYGSGEIREISEYAGSHNYDVTPQQASDIYYQLYGEHGSKIVDLKGAGSDTYVRGAGTGNIGLSHPGRASWYPGIEQQMRHMLEEASEANKAA